MKNKETLEEAAKKHANKIWDYSNSNEKTLHTNCKKSFLKGANWQAKRMYSEEEVISIYNEWLNFDADQDSYNGQDDLTFVQWFKKFKKK